MSIENNQSSHLTELVDSKNIVSRKSIENIYYNTIIFKLSADKSAQVLKSYMDKSYDVFSKKEVSIYVKQLQFVVIFWARSCKNRFYKYWK